MGRAAVPIGTARKDLRNSESCSHPSNSSRMKRRADWADSSSIASPICKTAAIWLLARTWRSWMIATIAVAAMTTNVPIVAAVDQNSSDMRRDSPRGAYALRADYERMQRFQGSHAEIVHRERTIEH